MITATSPAKIHLIGEYSAVLGKPAIVFPINLYLTVTLTPTLSSSHSHLSSSRKRGSILDQVENDKKLPFQTAIETAIEKKYHKKIPPYSMEIKSDIPTGSGLGSSAAISACLTKALIKMLGVKTTTEEIFQIALEGEQVFHGFPSGSDLYTVLLGKPLWYRKENPDLIILKTLDLSLPKGVFLIHSGTPKETTKQMVEYVMKNIPKSTFSRFAADQENLTKEMYTALSSKNLQSFAQIIQKSQQNLQKLQVISPKTQEMISKIEKVGGVAKITGAGGRKAGSGMLISYHKNPEKLTTLAKKNNWKIIPIKILP